jgi:hypothetical protein
MERRVLLGAGWFRAVPGRGSRFFTPMAPENVACSGYCPRPSISAVGSPLSVK